MSFELLNTGYERALPLFAGLDHHLIIRAVIEGTSPGRLYVDDPACPRSAFLISAEGYFVAGVPDNETFNRSLGRLAADHLFPELGEAEYGFDLHYAPRGWEARFLAIFGTEYPLVFGAGYYRFHGPGLDWRARLPGGYEVQPVDRELLAGRTCSTSTSFVKRSPAIGTPWTPFWPWVLASACCMATA